MVYSYSGVKIYFKRYGKTSSRLTLLLHGWGCDGKSLEGIVRSFPKRNFLVVDFPPFGKSGKNIERWNIFTYVNMVISLCEHLGIKRCDVLGHSFGGRVALLLAALRPPLVTSLTLVDAAGLKPKRKLSYYFKVFRYKLSKKFGRKNQNAGSEDYRNMPDNLKAVFVEVVNAHLDEYCLLVAAPTLIIFGKEDNATPIYMAKRFHSLIKGSQLVILEDAGHFSFLDSPLSFTRALNKFWEEI